jgi:predicted  nucleic acid-binding Zn-ribbon protein
MSAMSDPPVTLSVLAQFHRDVILPDVERVVGALMDVRLAAVWGHFDAIYQRFERLESEYHMLVAGLLRVEERLDRVEQRLDSLDLRVATLEADYRDLVGAVHQIDERLGRVEKRLDDLVAAQRRYALQSDVQQLRARLEVVEEQVDTLRKRIEENKN